MTKQKKKGTDNKNDRQDESRRVEVNERLHIADILQRALSQLVCFLASGKENKKREICSIHLGCIPNDWLRMSH